jgi:uncharacterized membrane protein
MIVIIVLVVGILIARGIGLLGVGRLNSWVAAVRVGLALMLLFTAASHFTSMRHDLARMIPDFVPYPMAFVYFTGVCEVLGAIGLLVSRVRPIAGLALIVFFFLVLPANIHAAMSGVTLRGEPATPLILRIPMQLLFIGLTWWSTLSSSARSSRN